MGKSKFDILIACEESQRTTIEFRKRGFNAFSCDIIEPSGGRPEWHILGNVLNYLNPEDGLIWFETMDKTPHFIKHWDLIIAHPPCTYLTVTGNRWFNVEQYGEKAIKRRVQREESAKFFMQFVHAFCKHIAVENPIGYMSTAYRKPDQIIQPYWFGDPIRKSTCLWLKDLPKLTPTKMVEPDIYFYEAANGRIKSDSRARSQCKKEDRSRHRSKTPLGLSNAMAKQWGDYLIWENRNSIH